MVLSSDTASSLKGGVEHQQVGEADVAALDGEEGGDAFVLDSVSSMPSPYHKQPRSVNRP